VRQSRGILGGAEKYPRRKRDLAAALKVMIVAKRARDIEQRDAIQIEHGLCLRVIARLHAVAGEASMLHTPIAAPPRISP